MLAGRVACKWQMRNLYKMLIGKPDEKSPLKKRKHRWDADVNMNLGEIGVKGVLDSSDSGLEL